jgi:hypothetical protein
VVNDELNSLGVSTVLRILLGRLIAIGRQEGVRRIYGSVLADNRAMLEGYARLGCELGLPEDGIVVASFSSIGCLTVFGGFTQKAVKHVAFTGV